MLAPSLLRQPLLKRKNLGAKLHLFFNKVKPPFFGRLVLVPYLWYFII